MGKLLHEALSYELVGALFEVHKVLGPGLLESAYEGALVIELQQSRFECWAAGSVPFGVQGSGCRSVHCGPGG
jgi:GxxExxY protein